MAELESVELEVRLNAEQWLEACETMRSALADIDKQLVMVRHSAMAAVEKLRELAEARESDH